MNHPPTTEFFTLSLHDALPILWARLPALPGSYNLQLTMKPSLQGSQRAMIGLNLTKMPLRLCATPQAQPAMKARSEEHTSELQSHSDLVCRLLLEKKKCVRVKR